MSSIFTRSTILVLLMLNLLFSGCAPVALGPNEVQGLQQGTTLWLINQATLQRPLSFMMGRDTLVLFASYMTDAKAWGFVAIDATKIAFESAKGYMFPNGNILAFNTLKELTDCLKQYGWKQLRTDELPSNLLIAIDSALATTATSLSQGLTWVSTSLPTILVIPVIEMPEDDFMRSVIDPSGIYNYSEE